MTQRAEENLSGALKNKSNLTIKQALNIVFITDLKIAKVKKIQPKENLFDSSSSQNCFRCKNSHDRLANWPTKNS